MNEKLPFTERRKHKRVRLKTNVEYKVMRLLPQAIETKNLPIKRKAESVDISVGGIQVIDDVALQYDQILRLRFKVESKNKMVNAFARIRWTNYDSQINKYRVGMEFFFLNDSNRELIKEITGE